MCEKSTKPTQPPIQPISEKPWQRIQIDIFGEVQAAPHSQRILVVIQGQHSKWPEIAATSTVTSSATIQIMKDLYARWGIPEVLQSDNGHEFETFLHRLGIKHRRSAMYNPQCYGGVDTLNQVIKGGLAAQLMNGKTFADAVRRGPANLPIDTTRVDTANTSRVYARS